jgi:hypothetical protein
MIHFHPAFKNPLKPCHPNSLKSGSGSRVASVFDIHQVLDTGPNAEERGNKNNSLWASKTGNSGHTESVTCDRGRRGVFGQSVPGSVNRNQSRSLPTSRLIVTDRLDLDHFWFADHPGLIACRPNSKCRTATSSVCADLGNLLTFGWALKSLYFAAIILRASTRGQAGSRWRPLPLQMRRA